MVWRGKSVGLEGGKSWGGGRKVLVVREKGRVGEGGNFVDIKKSHLRCYGKRLV